ncbi:Outer membrane receptor proteins, mostly Fe transport [Hyunsoonleella jejuensis]|uniref:Outer membrane receptor proteins, mostly Fe transport n=1 Tax=Hyunsoonleella jejuensis TaxID=419940 RepID=A0A1H9BNE6_9FLAO|nr:carboxypeptidase-like regulatory domain-containing protein [Hyunsoonleella jejuensis]SEP90480.1 Outer membrane receptor proteins, mostly Fe transport [Hyunsoonleella jejuensis]
MKKTTNLLIMVTILLFSAVAMAQSTITGTIVEAGTNLPLPGANVIEKGTSNGVTTDFDGNFSITTRENSGEIVITYIGYNSKTIAFSGNMALGNVEMASSQVGLEEIQIIASVAVDRKTPVAVSTVRKESIQLKLGNQEFPEILKSTPGVFVTRNGGGFGDGEVTMRGFNSENVAVLINGIPVNDMENGRVFWSNWAGLGSVTSSIQSQRGLGAAKIAVPSIGGTINTITESTDSEKGGFVGFDVGNDGYTRYGAKVSTGLQENGLAVTAYADRTVGDATYADGTNFQAVSYFLNVSYKLNDAHKLAFNVFGAKQRHGQRQNRSLINDYRQSDRGIRYNPDWGYKNGQITNIEDNFYHKPLMSINHYWRINDITTLSTSLYGSTGTGGGGGTAGDEQGKFTNADYKFGNFGPVNLDRIVDENIARGAQGASAILRASRNDHVWLGALSVLNTEINDYLDLNIGADYRYYVGEHFQEVTDLLGGQYFLSDDDINNPNRATLVGDKINYHDKGYHQWIGGFAQAEYDKDDFTAFAAINFNNSRYQREDFFQKLDSDPAQLTDAKNFFAVGGKFGASYRFDSMHNVFFNAGYFERVPFLDDVWLNFTNDDFNEGVKNQKITSFEIGYGLRSEKLAANVNVYNTIWKNRTLTADQGTGENLITANINGLEALHQGVEVDFEYRPFDFITVTGMVSFGDWTWNNNVTDVPFFDIDRNPVLNADGSARTTDIFLKGVPVGRSAQTTSALGLSVRLSQKTSFTWDYNFYDRYYADFNLQSRNTAATLETKPWKVPSYFLSDIILKHDFEFGPFNATIIGRINNLLDEEFINRADDGVDNDAATALVFFGQGRTFSISTKINF